MLTADALSGDGRRRPWMVHGEMGSGGGGQPQRNFRQLKWCAKKDITVHRYTLKTVRPNSHSDSVNSCPDICFCAAPE